MVTVAPRDSEPMGLYWVPGPERTLRLEETLTTPDWFKGVSVGSGSTSVRRI